MKKTTTDQQQQQIIRNWTKKVAQRVNHIFQSFLKIIILIGRVYFEAHQFLFLNLIIFLSIIRFVRLIEG